MNWLNVQLENNSQKVYIQEGSNSYTYLDVADTVQAYSQALLREGVQVGDRILIYLPCNIMMAEIILSCFDIGVIACPISTKMTKNELDIVKEFNNY